MICELLGDEDKTCKPILIVINESKPRCLYHQSNGVTRQGQTREHSSANVRGVRALWFKDLPTVSNCSRFKTSSVRKSPGTKPVEISPDSDSVSVVATITLRGREGATD
jgi:hypothetical protein